jgi:tRNA-dihydrouridine synthase
MMKYYFAPMEGITDHIYRRLHHKFFPGIDRYYTPFLSPTVHRSLTPKEQRELAKTDFTVVPQLLTKNPEDFCWMAQQCAELGYTEINLNAGCPSGTVTAKGKGSGMLRDPDALDGFLERIFRDAPLPISVKTRIGFEDPEEFPKILEIFNRYPICELIIHPRVRKAFYSGDVDLEVFRYATENTKIPLCFNGNLCSKNDAENFAKSFPQVDAVMLGRALIADPGMLVPGGTSRETLEAFLQELLDEYIENFGGAKNAMFRMKEQWRMVLCKFENTEKLGKKLRKTTDVAEFRSITSEILHTLPMQETINPNW